MEERFPERRTGASAGGQGRSAHKWQGRKSARSEGTTNRGTPSGHAERPRRLQVGEPDRPWHPPRLRRALGQIGPGTGRSRSGLAAEGVAARRGCAAGQAGAASEGAGRRGGARAAAAGQPAAPGTTLCGRPVPAAAERRQGAGDEPRFPRQVAAAVRGLAAARSFLLGFCEADLEVARRGAGAGEGANPRRRPAAAEPAQHGEEEAEPSGSSGGAAEQQQAAEQAAARSRTRRSRTRRSSSSGGAAPGGAAGGGAAPGGAAAAAEPHPAEQQAAEQHPAEQQQRWSRTRRSSNLPPPASARAGALTAAPGAPSLAARLASRGARAAAPPPPRPAPFPAGRSEPPRTAPGGRG
ncbi:dapper homolog 3-like [Vulpes lagopus]|uniref:dapper homolog 3-like n=1 Tax=Vulpes lagopus TaxID=494514 RepID=UPI001BCA41BF|nr:dapper homolog 3-like [Vulpes lagopus]